MSEKGDRSLWIEKYRPTTINELVGNDEAKSSFINWLRGNRKQKAVLIYGPAGVGKTALVHAAAHDYKYRVIEMNASDVRTSNSIIHIVGQAASTPSLEVFIKDTEGNMLLFDEVDGIFGKEDKGGVETIVKIIEESKIPIVMTANNPEILKLRPITEISLLLKFRGVRAPLIVALLQRICQKEEISTERGVLELLARNSQGDVRSAINDLQTISNAKNSIKIEDTQMISIRNRNFDLHKTLKIIFSSSSQEEARLILSSSGMDYNTLLLTIHDNLPIRYKDPMDLASAYEILSRADLFIGRIGKDLWHLLIYVYDLLAQSISISPKTFYNFKIIFPPTKFSLLKFQKYERAVMEELCSKISDKCHVSKRSARLDFIPFISMIIKKDFKFVNDFAKWFGIDENLLRMFRSEKDEF